MTQPAKHTPGPWRSYNMSRNKILKQWHIQRDDCRHDIALVSLDVPVDDRERVANLIAAAPVMYEALVMLLDNMHDKASVTAKWLIQRDTPVNEVIPYLSSHDEIAWYQIIRTALAQADGKQKVS